MINRSISSVWSLCPQGRGERQLLQPEKQPLCASTSTARATTSRRDCSPSVGSSRFTPLALLCHPLLPACMAGCGRQDKERKKLLCLPRLQSAARWLSCLLLLAPPHRLDLRVRIPPSLSCPSCRYFHLPKKEITTQDHTTQLFGFQIPHNV